MNVRRRQSGRDHTRLFAWLGLGVIALAVVIGLIAYNANSGLPWESRYEVIVEVPDANRLIDDAEVRIGGVQVGDVLGVVPEPGTGDAPPFARLRLALNPETGPLPVDTAVQVRPASVLGLTYVALIPGTSTQTVPAGGTLKLANATGTVDLTDLFSVFKEGAAKDFQDATRGFAVSLAGRGEVLNQTIGSVAGLLAPLTRVARVLADNDTGLRDFVVAYDSFAGELGPVSRELADLVSGGAATLGAMARAQGALGQSIELAAPAVRSTTVAFQQARPALDGLSHVVSDLKPAAGELPSSLRAIDHTLDAGEDPLRQLPGFSGRLRTTMVNLEGLAKDPATDGSLRKLTELADATNLVMKVLEPEQVDCNMISNWGIDFSKVFGTMGVGDGPSLPNLVLTTAGANGEATQNARPSDNLGLNPLPHENAHECESGNEPWNDKQQLNSPKGHQSKKTRPTIQPPGVPKLARKAGLTDRIEGPR